MINLKRKKKTLKAFNQKTKKKMVDFFFKKKRIKKNK
jgi:hypothetical protein